MLAVQSRMSSTTWKEADALGKTVQIRPALRQAQIWPQSAEDHGGADQAPFSGRTSSSGGWSKSADRFEIDGLATRHARDPRGVAREERSSPS